MVYRRPVTDGQGVAAAGPAGDAVSQKVSDSVHQAQEDQDDLAASTRQRQEAVQELTGSSAVYNNGSSAYVVPEEAICAAAPVSPAESAVYAPQPGMAADRAGDQLPPSQEAAVPSPPSTSSSSGSDSSAGASWQQARQGASASGEEGAGALQAPTGWQAERSAPTRPSSGQRQSNAPQHLASQSLTGAKKAGSLQGARQHRGKATQSTQS